jgi:hypothetical protein
MKRRPAFDPRTVSRDIPGLLDYLLPQLTPGIVSALNRSADTLPGEPITAEDMAECELQHAMLFEIAFAVAEMMLTTGTFDWSSCVDVAMQRQSKHFDAKIPRDIPEHDKEIAQRTAINLRAMVMQISTEREGTPTTAPAVPGFQWISSGNGDFAVDRALIEVKCGARNFAASDYRQLIIYWLLSYARAVDGGSPEWAEGILVNPRSLKVVAFSFDEILQIVGAGRSKPELLGLFSSIVATRNAS